MSFPSSSSSLTRVAATALGFAIGCASLSLAADDTESRLNALEARLAALEAENSHLRTQLGEVSSAQAATVADKARGLRVAGYAQLHADFGGAPDARFIGTNNRLFIRRFDLGVKGKLAHNFDFKVESELASGSLGEKSGHTVRLTDAYVRWTGIEDLTLKFGQFKSAFGRAQLMSNTKLPWVERPLVSDRLTVSRQVGIAAEGKIGGDVLPTSYEFGVYNGTGSNTSFSVADHFMTAGRVETLLWQDDRTSWTVAANAYHYDGLIGRRFGWGVDTAISHGPLTLEAEYLNVENNDTNNTSDGWWVSGLWQVDPTWQAVLAAGSFNADTRIGGFDTMSYTVGTSYLIDGDNLKLTFNYLWGDAPTGQDGRFLSRLQVKF